MQVIDPGHKYTLLTLDGSGEQTLTFVKRHDPGNPERFPGNAESYEGTTMQSVLRAVIDRIEYLNNQIPHTNNLAIKHNLESAIYLLEERAAERHGIPFTLTINETVKRPLCPKCGHVICHHAEPTRPIPGTKRI